MNSAIEADSVSLILQCEDARQMAMAAAKNYLVEEAEHRTENVHGMNSLLLSA